MSIRLGKTRSGKLISASNLGILLDEQELAQSICTLDDWFDTYCVVSYVSTRDKQEARDFSDDAINLKNILDQLTKHPKYAEAFALARNSGLAKNIFDDLKLGRQLAFPEFREGV